jgi:hypothetical protein
MIQVPSRCRRDVLEYRPERGAEADHALVLVLHLLQNVDHELERRQHIVRHRVLRVLRAELELDEAVFEVLCGFRLFIGNARLDSALLHQVFQERAHLRIAPPEELEGDGGCEVLILHADQNLGELLEALRRVGILADVQPERIQQALVVALRPELRIADFAVELRDGCRYTFERYPGGGRRERHPGHVGSSGVRDLREANVFRLQIDSAFNRVDKRETDPSRDELIECALDQLRSGSGFLPLRIELRENLSELRSLRRVDLQRQ